MSAKIVDQNDFGEMAVGKNGAYSFNYVDWFERNLAKEI